MQKRAYALVSSNGCCRCCCLLSPAASPTAEIYMCSLATVHTHTWPSSLGRLCSCAHCRSSGNICHCFSFAALLCFSALHLQIQPPSPAHCITSNCPASAAAGTCTCAPGTPVSLTHCSNDQKRHAAAAHILNAQGHPSPLQHLSQTILSSHIPCFTIPEPAISSCSNFRQPPSAARLQYNYPITSIHLAHCSTAKRQPRAAHTLQGQRCHKDGIPSVLVLTPSQCLS
jgi:hypothetical protein